jgi:AmmeMemoRadiSam system protein B
VKHYSYFSTPGFFDDAYNKAGPVTSDPVARGIIVNHHLLASDLIAATIGRLATDQSVTVILVSPNHFAAGTGKVTTSAGEWQTPFGILRPNCRAIKSVTEQGLLTIDERPFDKEHGISGIVAFIKKSLPRAEIIPVIIKDDASDIEVDRAVTALQAVLPSETLVIGSFDFSHYVTDAVAAKWDEESIQALQNFDFNKLKTIHVDSNPGLRFTLKYLAAVGAQNFTVTANTNSARILGDLNLAETTSYVDGIFKP